jgi:hypothetical protein
MTVTRMASRSQNRRQEQWQVNKAGMKIARCFGNVPDRSKAITESAFQRDRKRDWLKRDASTMESRWRVFP